MGWLLALLAAVLGVVVVIAGVRGTQDAIFRAITGRGLDGGGASPASDLRYGSADAAERIIRAANPEQPLMQFGHAA